MDTHQYLYNNVYIFIVIMRAEDDKNHLRPGAKIVNKKQIAYYGSQKKVRIT